MALTKKQRQLAGNILQYVVLSEIAKEGLCNTNEEQEVLNELIENLDHKIGKIEIIHFSNLLEIVDYVKQL